MWLHYFLFLLICFISITGYIFSKRKQKNIFVLITVFALFFVIATFRDIGVGNDTIVYYRFFNEVFKSGIGNKDVVVRCIPAGKRTGSIIRGCFIFVE